MVEKITAGIRISVATHFEGAYYKNRVQQYAFGYDILIENQSKNRVQLLSRYWEIRDALYPAEVVQGDGVIGKQPVIDPGNLHTYGSGCILKSVFGAMSGHYNMINLQTREKFKVHIPIFKLNAPYILN